MPKRESSTRGSLVAVARFTMSWVLERPLAPQYPPTASGNPFQTSKSHCRERLPPEARSTHSPSERRPTAGLSGRRRAEGGCVPGGRASSHREGAPPDTPEGRFQRRQHLSAREKEGSLKGRSFKQPHLHAHQGTSGPAPPPPTQSLQGRQRAGPGTQEQGRGGGVGCPE